jgi:predicted nucleic acid-binding protein
VSVSYLLDTKVVSELRKQRPRGGVVAWLESMDTAAFRMWARFMHRKPDTLYENAMIAATAKVHGLTVAARNVADLNALGLETFNPFSAV